MTGRIPVLDELKGLAMVGVILYHAGGVLGWENKLHGDLGVDIFVFLSGIGLAYGSAFRGSGPFLLRRLLRIYPAYWIVLTLCCLAGRFVLGEHYSTTNLVLHYLGIHGWFGDAYGMSINDSFWYVTLIVSCYALYCVCHRWVDAAGPLLLFGATVSLGVSLVCFHLGQASMFEHLGLRLPCFFLGLLIGRLLKRGVLTVRLDAALALAGLLVTYVVYVVGYTFVNVGVGLALMAFYAFAWKWAAPARIDAPVSRALAFLGTHSLEIFLLHQPLIREYNIHVQIAWLGDAHPGVPSLILGMAVGLAITLVLSAELHRLVSRFAAPRLAPSG